MKATRTYYHILLQIPIREAQHLYEEVSVLNPVAVSKLRALQTELEQTLRIEKKEQLGESE